jgi:ribosomal protein S18 acetylase RimI-like enzyme
MIRIIEGQLKHIADIQKLERENTNREERISKYDIADTIWWGYVLIALNSTKPVGYLLAVPTRQGDIYSSDIVVHKDYRNKDIATMLYKKLFNITDCLPISAIINANNVASLSLHKKLGFQIIKDLVDAFGENCNQKQFLVKKI